MDPSLLEYYNSELAYMRKMAGEFAAAHPKVARRLGMQGMDVADPFVERLIEGFCFLSARTRLRLDAEFPRFTQRLLEVIYPNYVSPTPSMAVVRLEPSTAEGDLAEGFTVPRGSMFRTHIPPSQQTACRFLSGMDTVLWPLELTAAHLGPPPPEVSRLSGRFTDTVPIRSALHLRLRTVGGLPVSALRGLDRLPLYLTGDEQTATRLFELLHAGAVGLYARDPAVSGEGESQTPYVVESPVDLEGFGAEQSLLPLPWNAFHGHNLVHEYFACPARFLFLALRGLAPVLRGVHGSEVELVIMLDRVDPGLVPVVDDSRFALFCTPVINLFPMRADRVEVKPGLTEFHVVPDRSRPMDFEVHSIQQVHATLGHGGHGGHGAGGHGGEDLLFRPLYETVGTDPRAHGRYFSVRRERRRLSDRTRMHGAQAGHIGTEVFLSLVDQFEAPWGDDVSTLSVRVLATNRELPRLLPPAGLKDLTLPEAAPVRRATFLRFPTRPRPPHAERELAWRLIRYLSLNYLTLEEAEQEQGGQALRDFLTLMCPPDMPDVLTQIQSLAGCGLTPVTRRLPGRGPMIYGRGVRCRLMVDENGFSGGTPYIFGLILARFLSRHASLNTFVETELHTLQRGRVALWPAVKGGRGIL